MLSSHSNEIILDSCFCKIQTILRKNTQNLASLERHALFAAICILFERSKQIVYVQLSYKKSVPVNQKSQSYSWATQLYKSAKSVLSVVTAVSVKRSLQMQVNDYEKQNRYFNLYLPKTELWVEFVF